MELTVTGKMASLRLPKEIELVQIFVADHRLEIRTAEGDPEISCLKLHEDGSATVIPCTVAAA